MRRVEWDEPYPGYDKGECTVNLHCSMTVKDAIKASRAMFVKTKPDETIPAPKVLLEEFITMNWATVTEDNRVY